MSDAYVKLVNSPAGRNIAKKLQLPRPAVLRRYRRGQPLVPGPVLVVGNGTGTDDLAKQLLDWGQDVRRHATPKEQLGGIVLDLTALSEPLELSEPMLTVGGALRDLAPGGRVVAVSRPAA
ncbi:3-ketoacyl-(acyl-carrier-protein) reductase, partial [Arthrobacter crystallopoietes BAB-32]